MPPPQRVLTPSKPAVFLDLRVSTKPDVSAMALLRAELGGTLRAYFMMASCLAAAALMLVTLAFALCAWQTSGGMPLEILFLSCMLFPTGSHACACRRGPSLSKSPSGSRDFILGENAALRVEIGEIRSKQAFHSSPTRPLSGKPASPQLLSPSSSPPPSSLSRLPHARPLSACAHARLTCTCLTCTRPSERR